eukprot:403367992
MPSSLEMMPQLINDARDPRFQQNYNSQFPNSLHQQSQQMLQDYYRKNVNSNIFNQRSRSHQTIDPATYEIKHQYARILDFQVKEHEALKAKKRSEERSVSPQQQSFFDRFGQSDSKTAENLNYEKQKLLREQLKQQIEEREKFKNMDYKDKERYESQMLKLYDSQGKYPVAPASGSGGYTMTETIQIPNSHRQYPVEDYKAQLLEQIEEKRQLKENYKKQKMDDEMKDEMRVKRELEELKIKYQIEVGIKKIAQNEAKQKTGSTVTPQNETTEISQIQDNSRQKQRTPNTQIENQIHPHQSISEFPNHQQMLQQDGQLDPIKKQLQAQLVNFQKDIQKLQKQQQDMMNNYKKEVDQIQDKKEKVIKDVKYTQEVEMKKQIQQLQKALDSVTKSNNSLVKQSKNQMQQSPQISNHKKNNKSLTTEYQQNPSPSTKTPKSKMPNQITNQKQKKTATTKKQKQQNGKKSQKKQMIIEDIEQDDINGWGQDQEEEDDEEQEEDEDDLQNEVEEVDDFDDKDEGSDYANGSEGKMKKYNNSSQIILTPKGSKQQKQTQKSHKTFKDILSSGSKDQNQSIAQIMNNGIPFDEIPVGAGASKALAQSTNNFNNPGAVGGMNSARTRQSRAKMSQLINQSNSGQPLTTGSVKKQKLPPNTKSGKKLPPKLLQKLNQQKQTDPNENMLVPKNADNETLSMTNLFKKMNSMDRNQADSQGILGQGLDRMLQMTPSILRKGTGWGAGSQKSDQLRQLDEVYKKDIQSQRDNQFFMGKQNPTISDEVGSQYVQQSRDYEKIFYENVLRPDKIKDNIESHQQKDHEMPGMIGGIKIIDDQVDKQLQQLQQLQPANSQNLQNQNNPQLAKVSSTKDFDLDESNISRYTNFLFHKNLLNQDGEDENIDNDFMNEDQAHLSMLKETKPQYMLKEKTEDDGSFNDYQQQNTHEGDEMKNQLNAINQIIEENHKYSEDYYFQSKQNNNKEIVEFNKTFEKNLKEVGDLFEEDKITKKVLGPIKTTVNISLIDKEDGSSPFSNRATNTSNVLPKALQRMKDLEEQKQKKMYGFQIGTYDQEEEKDEIDPNLQQNQILNQENSTSNHQGRKNYKDYEQEIPEEMMNKQPQQFHLLNFLMSDKNSPPMEASPSNANDLRMINQAVALDSKSQYTQLGNLSSQTPKHFSKIIKNQLLPILGSEQQSPFNNHGQQQNSSPGGFQNRVQQQTMPIDTANNINTNIIPRAKPQLVRQHTQQHQSKKPPLPIYQQQRQRLQEAQLNLINAPYQQYQEQQSHQNSQRSQDYVNVFSENSQINEEKMPMKIFNPYFRVEQPANKIYDKNDPFLINLNLRQKLTETNQMIYVDNQNLLEKIKKLGRSIKPVTYGYPYIDLTQKDAFTQEVDEAKIQQEIQTQKLKNNMQEYFGNPGQSSLNSPAIQFTQDLTLSQQTNEALFAPNPHNPHKQQQYQSSQNQVRSKNDQVIRYLNYNFNGETGVDLKQKLLNHNNMSLQNLNNEDTRNIKLLKYAQSTYKNELVTQMVQDKLQSDQHPAISNINGETNNRGIMNRKKSTFEFLNYLQDANLNESQEKIENFSKIQDEVEQIQQQQQQLPVTKGQTYLYPQQNIIINTHEGTPLNKAKYSAGDHRDKNQPFIKFEEEKVVAPEEFVRNAPSPLNFLNVHTHHRQLSQNVERPEKQLTILGKKSGNNLGNFNHQNSHLPYNNQKSISEQNNYSQQQQLQSKVQSQQQPNRQISQVDQQISRLNGTPTPPGFRNQDSIFTEKTPNNQGSNKQLFQFQNHSPQQDPQLQQNNNLIAVPHHQQNKSLFKIKTAVEGSKAQNFQREENQMTYMKLATTNDPDHQFDAKSYGDKPAMDNLLYEQNIPLNYKLTTQKTHISQKPDINDIQEQYLEEDEDFGNTEEDQNNINNDYMAI